MVHTRPVDNERKSWPSYSRRSLQAYFSIRCVTVGLVTFILLFLVERQVNYRRHYLSPEWTHVLKDAVLPFRLEDHSELNAKTYAGAAQELLNSTLGFGRIYVLNLPARTDKHAELTILANQYALEVEFVDGVNGTAERPDLTTEQQGQWGCAEGHARVWERMLTDHVETAMIFEDDVDFSTEIRKQIAFLQKPLAILFSLLDGQRIHADPRNDPYGAAHWDMLWLGHEREHAWEQNALPHGRQYWPFVTYEDPTRSRSLIDRDKVLFDTYGIPHGESEILPRLRILQPAYDAWSLGAYALTASGARKALYKNAHKTWVEHIDFDLMMLSREKRFRSFTVNPPLFQQRKPESGEDSDRAQQHAGGKSQGSWRGSLAGKKGRTSGIDSSARAQLEADIAKSTVPLYVPPDLH